MFDFIIGKPFCLASSSKTGSTDTLKAIIRPEYLSCCLIESASRTSVFDTGPTSAFLKELTGYSFTNAVKRIQVDVNLNGVNFTGNLTEAQARAIGAEIGLQLKSSGAIS